MTFEPLAGPVDCAVHPRRIALARMNPPGATLSLLIALAAFTSTPPEGSGDFLRIQVGTYLITYFDFAVMLASLSLLVNSRLRITLSEKKIVWALVLVILTRILSLLLASTFAADQVVSVLRYVEVLVTLVVLANLLSTPRNRRFFLAGIMLGVLIETVGDLAILITTQGDTRGFWLGIDNYKWQVYLLFVCILFLASKRYMLTALSTAAILFLGIIATETRAALVLFCIVIAISLLTGHRHLLKPVVISSLVLGIAVLPLLKVFPDTERALGERIQELWLGGGVIGYRVILVEMAAAAYISHPVTGIGSGGFAREQNSLYVKINDAFAPEYEGLYGSLSTHNTVLGVAAETGTVGLIAYCFWVSAVVRICLNSLASGARSDNFALAACLLMLAYLLQDFWGQASFLSSSSCLMGLILGWRRDNVPRVLPANLEMQPAAAL